MNKNLEICYESDSSRLKGKVMKVIFPESVEEVCSAVKGVGESDIVIRGFGVSLVGGCVPNNSVVVDMRKMNRVTQFEGKKRTVNAEAGVSVRELNEKLNALGYEFPVFSSDSAVVSVGGMIALDMIGDRSMKYGSVKDWIEELIIVNGRGEIVKIGKADLMDICGMEGITGVIVSAKLKIAPLIKRSASFFQSDSLDEVLSIARRLKLERDVVMLRFYSKEVSLLFGFPEKYHIIIEFNSEKGRIRGRAYEEILKIKNKERFFLYSKGYYNNEDPMLFYDKIGEFVELLEKIGVPYFADLGLGIIYPFFKDSEEHKKERVFNFLKNTKTKFSVYGFGLKRKVLIESGDRKVFQRVKMRYDPFLKINKGKVIDVGGLDSGKIVEEIESPFKEVEGSEVIGDDVPQKSIEDFKTPEEKIEELIREEGKVDEVEDTAKIIEEQRSDYERTFNSELENSRRMKVEDFSKSVPREIVKKERESVGEGFKDTLDRFGLGAGLDKKKKEDENKNE